MSPALQDSSALRRAAEARLRTRGGGTEPPAVADLLRIHYELEVHQTELEMQNE